MDQIENGWFSERSQLWPGQAMSLQVQKVLYHEKSEYQDILILNTKSHGRTLVLDGIIQCTEYDEFSYQEAITFFPLCAHSCPMDVLIVGGGDGGVAREVAKHPLVKHITQVEIDGSVIEASKKYLPFMAVGFDSPKLDLHVCDGFEFMQNHTNSYDVIITDSSDPIGPAVNLFTESYFALLKRALKPNGIICSQAGTIWNNLRHVRSTTLSCRKHFANVRYAYASVPTYPTGQIGFIIATDNVSNDLQDPKQLFDVESLDLKYYNADVHKSAFVLPTFAKRAFI
ncbi:PREDICTED: spermidine synthase [Nicrophorus vespilloides]|uniref:Spermidine synthase n=1 Tax=Nicrophorus vespilloides TaxID=110193 RepID=A0ABM1MRQ5_NICVS|nr:PREDICTED: spermidine synthase [Nicrophorus vespilloides]